MDEELGPEVLELGLEKLLCLLQPPQLVSLLGISTDSLYSCMTFPGRATLYPQVLTSLKLILLDSALLHLNCFLQLGPHMQMVAVPKLQVSKL